MPAEPSESGGNKGPAESGKASLAPSPARSPSPWAIAFGTGSAICVSVLGGFFIGRWLDRKFGTDPWLTLFGAMFGLICGLYQLFKILPRGGKSR